MAKHQKQEGSVRASYGRLWRDWLKPHRAVLGFTILLMIIVGVSSAGYAKFIEIIISAFENSSTSVVWWGPVGIIILTLARGISRYFQLVLQNRVLTKVQAQIQTEMYSQLVSMDLAYLLAESPAALSARFSADIDLIKSSTAKVFGSISALITLIATFAIMLSIDWAMTIGLIFIFCLAFGPIGIVGARVRTLSAKTQSEISEMTESVNEGLSGIRMVRAYRLEERLKKSSERVFERLFELRLSMVKWQATLSPLMEILGGLAVAALLFLVALRMQSGAIDLAGFIGLLTALGVATNPASKLGNSYSGAQQGRAALDRVFALFDTPNVIKGGKFEYTGDEKSRGKIEFRDVDFTYPDGYQALKRLNLEVASGKTYAFVGRSGAGKSTVFNLLPRLFDATSGVILLDGRPITEYALAALRDQISVVSQDSVLLSGTVLENIGFGREGASREDCIKAAKAAAAVKFIHKLEDGFDTLIEPSKSKFSGGERQRLSIARAILRDAPILLLDEPTSALDAESENQIREALDALSEKRTTLIIAHRLSTILDADQIVVMDQGMIVDQGTHEELLAGGGIYSDLFNLQFDLSPHSNDDRSTRHLNEENKSRWKSPLEGFFKFFGS